MLRESISYVNEMEYGMYDQRAFSSFLHTSFGSANNTLNELYKELGVQPTCGGNVNMTNGSVLVI